MPLDDRLIVDTDGHRVSDQKAALDEGGPRGGNLEHPRSCAAPRRPST